MWPLKVELKRWWYSDRRNGARYYMIQDLAKDRWFGQWFHKNSAMDDIYRRSVKFGFNDVLTYDEYKALKK